MGLTKDQKKCATTFGTTLAIKAGAGSGKTFTLTERIANAYKQNKIDSISEVCAITFTNAAANELKARIAKKLKDAEGVEDDTIKKKMQHDAYYVDNAWISTIHGFCSRILKESAVSLGINSHFDIIPNYVRDRLIKDSVNETLEELKFSKIEGINPTLALNILKNDKDFESTLTQLIEEVSAHIDEWDAIDKGIVNEQAKEIAEQLAKKLNEMITLLEDEKCSGKTAESMRCLWTQISNNLNELNDTCDPAAVVKCIEDITFNERISKKTEFKEKYIPLINDACLIVAKLYQLKNKPYLDTVINIAKEVQKKYDAKKKQLGCYDNNDLLRQAYYALKDHKDILDRYKDKFKIIMVDEFQDTDRMQFETIKMLAGEDLERLCVVGDFQQSIYRFRGADVSIFKDHIHELGEESRNVIKLGKNFRSHASILAYAEHIFVVDDMFGEDFLNLECGRDDTQFNLGKKEYAFKRINLIYASNLSSRSFSDEQKEQARRCVAQKVATLFKELEESYGHQPKEMALLLEKMNDASLYAEEFNKVGLPSIISGGSGLNDTNEIQLLIALMKFAVNPYNTESLATILLSPLFSLQANDLLGFVGEKKLHSIASIAAGFTSPEEHHAISAQMLQALRILQMFIADVKDIPLSLALNKVFVRSGYYFRKESDGIDGLASIGNIKKGIHILQSIENESPTGLDSLCTNFIDNMNKGKESPGMLALDDMNCIKIMTIHASKGLEFPIVAVGGFSERGNGDYKLRTTTYKNKIKSYYPYEEHSKLKDKINSDFKDEESFNSEKKPFEQSIIDEERKQDEAERKRLLYVALTRAREVLIVADTNIRKKTKDISNTYPVNKNKSCSKGVFLSHSDPHSDQLAKNINGDLAKTDELSFNFNYGGEEEGVFYHFNLTKMLSKDNEPTKQAESANNKLQQISFKAPKIDEIYSQYSTKILPHAFLAESSENEDEATQTEQTNVITLPSPLTSYSSFISEENEEQNAIISQLGDTYCTTVDRAYVDTSSKKDAAKENDTKTHLSAEEVEDRATNLGSAFHRLAQYASICRLAEDSPSMPSADKIKRIGRAYQLDEVELKRIEAAIKLWVESPLAKTTFAYPIHKEEMEFAVPLQGMPVVLEGAIDLYCGNEDGSKAWIIDYKTGGHDFEREATLKKKHALQAAVYAYIALSQGALEVDVVFARIEHASEGNPKEPQKVIYHFKKSDLEDISTKLVAIKNAE